MPRQNSSPAGALSAIAGLLGLSMLAGLLVTALVTPAIAVTSMTANSSIGIFESLPDYMEISKQSQKNVLWGTRDGQPVQFAELFKQNREEVTWDEVSPLIKQALVAGEDRRFYQHGGVDMQSIIRAAVGNISNNEIGSGASTLSMQLVKNILIMEAFQIPDKDERDKAMQAAQARELDRKLKEAKMAIGLEKRYTKNEIMLAYLNITGFGGNTYGIEAAAQQYLSKSAADVTLAEAASLIAIVQLPNERNLKDPKLYPANKIRRDQILDIMLQLKMVTKEQHDEAIATPIEDYVKITPPTQGCTYATDAKTFCDYIVKKVKDLEMLGSTPDERQRNWDRGGYNVYTTIDLNQQDNAQAQIQAQAPKEESRFELGAAVSSTEVGTGRILIMAQNKDFNDSGEGGGPTTTAVNFNTDQNYGGSFGFPTGSTYKVFTLIDWLQNGHGLNEVVNGSKHDSKYFKASCVPGGGYVMSPPYSPRNDAGESGPYTVVGATRGSVNAAFISMAEQLDLCEIRDVAKSMGVHRADGNELETFPTSVLGVNEIAPLTMAAAVATIAGGGLYCEPIAIDKIVSSDGTDLGGEKKNCRQAISPDIAAGAAYAMASVMNGGTGNASNPRNGVPLIGKTGTTDDSWHTWMMGSSTKTSLIVWVGNIIGKQQLRRINVAGGNAATARHRIAKPIFAALTSAYGGDQFPDPPSNLLRGNAIEVPDVTGQSMEQAKSLLESLGFQFQDGGVVASDLPVGRVAGTDPAAGTKVSKGYQITVFTSDGSLYVQMPDDLIGKSPSQAKSQLVSLGFAASNITIDWVKMDDPVDPGSLCKVTATDPAGGAGTSTQAKVTLTVSSTSNGHAPPGCSA